MRCRQPLVVIALSVLVLAGCGHTVPGIAVPAAHPPTTVDVSQLDIGAYPITPAPPMGSAATEEAGRMAEGQRMAGYVVGPWQVDPRFVDGGSGSAAIVTEPNKLGSMIWVSLSVVAHPQPFLVAFSSDRRVKDPKEPTALRNTVLLFTSADAAAEAARGMVRNAMDASLNIAIGAQIPSEPIRAVSIPGHPDAAGVVLTHVDGGVTVPELAAITAHGPAVLVQVARSVEGPERAVEFASRTLDLQIPLIDGFTPTDPAQLVNLPLDPSGLSARTLVRRAAGSPQVNATYDRSGALHLEDHPIEVGAGLTEAGVDVVTIGQDTVYRAADADQARQLADKLAEDIGRDGAARTVPQVPGLPQSHCLGATGGLITRHWCVAAADRFVIKTVAQQLISGQQQVAAQYRMLVG